MLELDVSMNNFRKAKTMMLPMLGLEAAATAVKESFEVVVDQNQSIGFDSLYSWQFFSAVVLALDSACFFLSAMSRAKTYFCRLSYLLAYRILARRVNIHELILSTDASLWSFWVQQKESVPPPRSRMKALRLLRDLDWQLNPDSAFLPTFRGLTPGRGRRTGFCFRRTKANKGAPLYERKATSKLDETARSESTNQGVHLRSKYRRTAERAWLFFIGAIDRTTPITALNGAAIAGGVL
jgi:hypothetical protein